MEVFLPVANQLANPLLLIAMGLFAGILAGIFGVGGGFIMTPVLLLYGIPPAVAVGTETCQVFAASLSGALGHWRRGSVDTRMGALLAIGGVCGSVIGIRLFQLLHTAGNLESIVPISYAILLGTIGSVMLFESIRTGVETNISPLWEAARTARKRIAAMPFKIRYPQSRLYGSVFPPLILGLLIGVLAGLLGVGGGFILVPAMIYVLRMSTDLAVGTSLFQIVFVTAIAGMLHLLTNNNVDFVLAALLSIGALFGARIGIHVGAMMSPARVRIALGVMILIMCIRLSISLIAD